MLLPLPSTCYNIFSIEMINPNYMTHLDHVVRIIITWSECNYRISENADISMVCWQSARGIYSKKFKNDENNAAQQDNGRRFHI